MWEQDWTLLGLEPTTELAAIKKAYALKLRVTRPDDDAEAYQALRGAYERAQQWAKWQREAPPPDLEAAEPAPRPEPVAEPTPAPVHVDLAPLADEPPPPPPVQPRDLVDALELSWRRGGEEALMQAWPEVRLTLDQQPLARRAEFSAAFAQWLVRLPQLPDAFAVALNEHFEWLRDFRTERLIGPALAQAVQAALEGRVPQPLDPALQAAAEPLLGLAALRAAGRWWRLLLAALALQPSLVRLMAALGPAQLRRVGLDLEAQRWLREQLSRALWMRVGLCGLPVLAAAWISFGNGASAAGRTLTWGVGMAAWMGFGVLAGSLVNVGPSLGHRALPLAAWRQRPLQPVLGLVWLLFAAWLAAKESPPDTTTWQHVPPLEVGMAWLYQAAAWGFGIAGLVVAWPLVPLHGWVLAALAPLVAYLASAALGGWLPVASSLCVGAAWMLWAAAVHAGRLPAPGVLLWAGRPVMNTLAVAERWTYSLALLPLAVVAAWAVLRNGEVRPLHVFALWALSILATGWTQNRLDAWGLRQLPAADRAG